MFMRDREEKLLRQSDREQAKRSFVGVWIICVALAEFVGMNRAAPTLGGWHVAKQGQLPKAIFAPDDILFSVDV